MKKKTVPLGAAIMLIFLAAVATLNVTFLMSAEYYGAKLGNIQQLEDEYRKFKELEAVVNQYFVGEYEQADALDGAMAGYIKGLGDQWSGYYSSEQYKLVQEMEENSYVGIGVTIGTQGADMYKISSVSKGGPADKAGIRVTDVIAAVDGTPATEFETSTDLVNAVRGEEGSIVKITIMRDGEGEKTFDIARGKVFNESVSAKMLGNIGYVRIEGFDNNVDTEFSEKVDQLVSQGASSLIFDVRYNPGGSLDVLVNMLDKLLPEGTVISMSYKDGTTKEYKSDANKLDIPMAVLVNDQSISAAEFFAASLQEYGAATIIGQHTAGKGYAQSTIELSDGSAVHLSIARYYTPKGKNLAGVGIAPDVELIVPMEELLDGKLGVPETDPQLQKAIEILTQAS